MKLALPILAFLLVSCAGTVEHTSPPDPRPVFAFNLVPQPQDGNGEATPIDLGTFIRVVAYNPKVDRKEEGSIEAAFESVRTNRYRKFYLAFPQESELVEGASFPLVSDGPQAFVLLFEADDIDGLEQKGAWVLRNGTLTVTKKESRRVTMALDAVSTETGGEATGELQLTGTVEIDFARAEQVP